MSLRYAVLSLVALFVIFLLILKNYETWTRTIETAPERSTPKKQEAKIEHPPALRPQKVAGPAQSYVVIAGKNIFSPDRKDFPVQSSEARRLVRPQIILYGVTISEGYQFASIANPGRALQKGERETFTIKLGEKVGEYKLTNISSDRITLEAEGDNFEVLLYDPRIPKKRISVKTETKPTTVTTTSPATAGPIPTTTVPAPPSTSTEAAKPSPPPQAVGPPPPGTASQTTPPTDIRRGRRIFYPPSGTPAQGTGGNQ